jgi:membrane fusion protein, multidrug efflux system
MSAPPQPLGSPAHSNNGSYDDMVVRAFFAVLVTISIVATSAAVIVSALSRRPAATPAASAMMTPAAPSPPTTQPAVHVTIAGGSKMGPDGKMHDAFSVTTFAVRVGVPTQLVINNTDSATHTITAPAIGVNIVARQGIHSYTLLVNKAGRFRWSCVAVCDTEAKGWAMANVGYMSGYIVASPAPAGA